MRKLQALLVFGTRPEAIKMVPVVRQCRRRSEQIDAFVCVTGQHLEMLSQVTDYFNIRIDECLDVMRPNQTLAGLTARCLEGIDAVIDRRRPHCVVAQGDTTSALAAGVAAFYRGIPFVHVEAGLRTRNLLSPWPEEFNRRVADLVAALYCAPTRGAAEALAAEGIPPAMIRVTGNTVIDALFDTVLRERGNDEKWRAKYPMLENRRMVLITGHRRESFGQGFENICRAVTVLAENFADCAFLYPVHLNPNVQRQVYALLGNRENVHLLPPVPYPEFIWLMDRSTIILTDSGGVQEEAPSLGKPVLVMRETTERPEAVACGAARLVGTSADNIIREASRLLSDAGVDCAYRNSNAPYGDGHAAERIVDWMLEQNWQNSDGG